MALPALLGAGAKAIGGSMVKAGGRAAASKILGRGRKKQAQPGRIVPGREGVDGGKGSAIIKPKVKMVSAKEIKSLQTGDAVSPGKDPLKSIYSNVIIIEKILKGTLAAEKDQQKQQKKDDKKGDREAQEKKLETKTPNPEKKKLKMPKVPGMGIFGFIKNFIGNVILGYFAVRLVKFLPQMLGLLKGLGKVVDFVTDVGMFLVDGVATFIDFAYNVYDGTRNLMKNIGGDALMGAFDGIMKAVEVAITVLTFALGAKSLGGFGDSRGGGKGKGKPQTRVSGPKGNLLGSQDRVTSSSAARRYANRFGRDAAEKRFGRDAVSGLGGKFGRSKATNFARGAATGVAKKLGGRGGVKMLASLGKIGKFLKVPVIGSIISVVLSLMAGDPIQKALFKGVGSAVGGALGGLLSTAIGVPPLGLFLGGIIGDYVGDLLYTLFFGGGLKAAGSKFINDIKGIFTGIGDGAKAMFSWVFGGGLLDLLKNVGGGLLKFAGYILNPGGLLWDMLKAGGAVIGAITNFIFGGGLIDLIKNVGGGVLKFIGYILNPGGLLFDALKAGGAAAKMILDFAKSIVGNIVGGAVEGTKRATGGLFDALTFNLFDFDKQNEVESKKAGGVIGREFQKDTIDAQKKSIRKKPSYEKIKAPEDGKIKTGKKTTKAWWDFMGWAGTEGEDETIQLGGGGMMLANRVVDVGNAFGDHPYFGPILSLAAKVILGQTPDEQEYKNVGYGLNMLVGDGINKGKINEGVKGYEDGGLVKEAMAGVDISRWATDTFRKELSETLYKNFDKKNLTGQGSTSGPDSAPGVRDSATGELQGGTAGGAISPSQLFAKIGANAEQWDIYRNSVALIESNGDYSIPGGSGMYYDGRYQMGGEAKEDGAKYAGVPNPGHSDDPNAQVRASYRADKELQETIFTGYTLANHTYLMGNETYKNSDIERKLQILGYAHNQGMGNAEDWIVTGVVGKDGFGTKGTKYTDLIAANFRAKKSGGDLQIAEGAISVPVIEPSERPEMSASSGDGTKSTGVGGAGMYTGPAGHIGAGAAYHVDTKFHDSIGMGGMISAMDKLAQEYASKGREMVFSGQGYARLKAYKSDLKGGEKQKLLKSAIDAHSHSSFMRAQGFLPFDYYIPNTGVRDLFDPSTEGAEILIPSFGGNKKVGSLYGGYGRSADIYDSAGKHVAMTGHGDLRRSHAGTKLSNREEMLKILPGQSLLDENTSKSLGATNLARFNAASTPEGVQNIIRQIAGISDYAEYEQGAEQIVMVQDPPQQQMLESPSSSGGGMMVIGGGSNHDPFEFLDYQG